MAVDQFAALRRLAEARNPVEPPPSDSVNRWNGYDLDALAAQKQASEPSGIKGFVAESLDNPIGRGAMTVLDWLGTGKSYIASGLKEAGDWLNQIAPDPFIGERSGNEGWDAPSWEDFKRQGSEGYGFGDIVEASQPDMPHAGKVALGILGDIAIDPLTYMAPLGKATIVGKGALAEAYRGGARNVMAEALAQSADQAGLAGNAAVQSLVKGVALRGRGGLTKGAIRKAGVTVDQLAQLGVDDIGRKFLGKTFTGKGAQALTGGIETVKGAAKQALGDTGAAKFYRMLRMGDRANKRALTDLMRNVDTDAKKVLQTALMSGESKRSVRKATRWGEDWMHKAAARFKDSGIYGISDDAAVDLTHRVEAGLLDQADAATGRQLFDDVGNSMINDHNVPLEMNVPNYVPHVATREARAAAMDNPQLQEFISRIDDEAFFLKKRTDTRSIAEINQESMDLFGVKVLEDDFRDLVAIYMGSAQKQVERQILQDALVRAGIAVDRPLTRALSAEQEAARDALVASVRQARKDVTVALSNGRKVRRSMLKQVRKEVEAQRKTIMQKLNAVRNELAALEAKQTAAARRLAGAEALVRDLEKTVEDLRVVARGSRGSAKANLTGRIKRAEQALAKARQELKVASKKISKTTAEPLDRLAKVKPYLDEIDALERKLAALGDDMGKLDEAITPLGARAAAGETAFRMANTPYEVLQREVVKSGEVLADVGPMIADQTQMRALLDDSIAKLDELFSKLKPSYRSKVDIPLMQEHIDESIRLIDSLADPALREQFGPVVDVMLAQQQQALMYDVTAALRGQNVVSMETLLNTMSKPDFGEAISFGLDKGWRAMGEKYQVPAWVDDILATQIKLSDPEVWTDFVDKFRKIQNVWKGMATSRPGFVIRNMVSSTFNMYLEAGAGSLQLLDDFAKFVRIRAKNPENYLEVAAAQGLKDLDLLNEAFSAVAGSGSGQVSSEFLTTLGRGKSWAPWKSDFGGYRAVRSANEAWETTVRGAHALAVLKRGGTVDQAVDVVSKWHFNYRDLSRFDRAIKNFVPFWSFFSNNMALQAHIWTHELPKLSRTVMNLKRNVERDQPRDRDVPYYIADQMLLGTGINPSGESKYRDLGIPSMQYVGEIGGLYRNPAGMASSMLGPAAKMPLEMLFRKNLMTGKEYEGVTDYLGQNWQGLLPIYANAERIAQIADEGTRSKGEDALLSFITGVGTRRVTPQSRSFERRRRAEENR